MTSGNYKEVPESSCLENPIQNRIIKSYQHFQELRTLPSSLFTYWELSVTGDYYAWNNHLLMQCHSMPIIHIAIPELAQESAQLIQKHLRLTVIKLIYSSLLLTSPA